MYTMICGINGHENAIVKMTNGTDWADWGNKAIVYRFTYFIKEKRITKQPEPLQKHKQSFLEPIQISQGSDNVIHYVKYPKRTTIWEREHALVFWASQVEKSCFCRLGTGTLSQGTAGRPAWLQARLVIC